jgi:copper chaperone CopZ
MTDETRSSDIESSEIESSEIESSEIDSSQSHSREIEVTGMSCQHCVGAVTRALEAVPGVARVQVDLGSGIARVQGDADPQALVQSIIDAGYGAEAR